MTIQGRDDVELEAVAGSLHREFDTRLGVSTVDTEIRKAAHRFVDARIHTFVPLLVGRFATRALRERLRPPATNAAAPAGRGRDTAREIGEPPHSVYS